VQDVAVNRILTLQLCTVGAGLAAAAAFAAMPGGVGKLKITLPDWARLIKR